MSSYSPSTGQGAWRNTNIGSGATLALQVNSVFKTFYLPGITDQLQSKTIASKIIPKDTQSVVGDKAYLEMRVSRNEGMGAAEEGGALPIAGRQGYQPATYQVKSFYAAMQATGQSKDSSRNDAGAFIRVWDAEIRGVTADVMKEVNRIVFGDGTGRLARVSAIAGGNTIFTLDRPGGFAQNLGRGTQYLRVGMRVCMFAPAATSVTFRQTNVGANRVFIVRSVNYAAGTVTFANPGDAAGTAARVIDLPAIGDFLCRANVLAPSGDPDYREIGLLNEPQGLAALIDDGNPDPVMTDPTWALKNAVGGIDATTVDVWRSPIVDNGGVPVPFNFALLQAAGSLQEQAGYGSTRIWLTTYGIRDTAVNELLSQKRFVNTMELEGGWNAITYNGSPIVPDADATRGRMYGLDREAIREMYETDWHWLETDGIVLNRVQGYDIYGAELVKRWQWGTDARNRLVGVFDIIDA